MASGGFSVGIWVVLQSDMARPGRQGRESFFRSVPSQDFNTEQGTDTSVYSKCLIK